MERWGKVKGDRIKALFMLGGTCLKEMQDLAIHARECNWTAFPYYAPLFKPGTEAQLVDFCGHVADTVPDMPFITTISLLSTGGVFSMGAFLPWQTGRSQSGGY